MSSNIHGYSSAGASKGNTVSEEAINKLVQKSQNIGDVVLENFKNSPSAGALGGKLGGHVGKLISECISEHYKALVESFRGLTVLRQEGQKQQAETIEEANANATNATNSTYGG